MRSPGDRPLRWISAALGFVIALEFLLWLPGYLTRPLFADHDVFATMAQGWGSGLKPYRDLASNNFPGAIYLFWGLGQAFGWGHAPALYAADAALLVVLAVTTVLWSRVRFGRALPGLVGLLGVFSYYLNLDFTQTAQRDWHASAFVVLGLLVAQARPNRGGRWLAALGFASGMLVRPQVILILPAMLMAVTEGPRLAGAPRTATIRSALAWLVLAALLVAVGFVPLVRDGLMGDFWNGLRALAFGGSYNKKSVIGVLVMFGYEVNNYRVAVVLASLTILVRAGSGGSGRSLAMTWLIALAGALFYGPLSPGGQPYLFHPLWLTWTISLAVLSGWALEADIPPRGLLYVLLAIHLAVPSWPSFSWPAHLSESLAALRKGREVQTRPAGYQQPYGDRLVLPPWEDYRALLDHLRTTTASSTRVANLVKGMALTGALPRLPALPAESATWVFVVKPGDEERFARALEECPDSVVVTWAEGQGGTFDHPLPKIDAVVRRLYVADARFGTLQVWRRRPNP